MKYILNSAVITTPGVYSYDHIDVDEAIDWLQRGAWVSTIGYRETAIALEQITGISIPVNRQQIYMEAGDEALVFRLTKRLSEPEIKGAVGVETILTNCEIGILKKVGRLSECLRNVGFAIKE